MTTTLGVYAKSAPARFLHEVTFGRFFLRRDDAQITYTHRKVLLDAAMNGGINPGQSSHQRACRRTSPIAPRLFSGRERRGGVLEWRRGITSILVMMSGFGHGAIVLPAAARHGAVVAAARS